MLSLAERGENANVDMLVGDIYGSGYGRIGLKATTIASTFGKVFKQQKSSQVEEGKTPTPCGGHFAQEDISRSLLYAVRSVNINTASLGIVLTLLVITLDKSHICKHKTTILSTYISAALSFAVTDKL